VPPYELRFLIRAVLVQSLVRTTCRECGGSGKDKDGMTCQRCFGSGYGSRTVISECQSFVTEADVNRAISGERWWPEMAEDAVLKYRNGETTEAELRRVMETQVAPLLDACKPDGTESSGGG